MAVSGRHRERPDGTPEDGVDDDDQGHMLSPEELVALGTFHSGLAEVSVQEWAILLRCNADAMVAADELVASLLEWFPTPLSAAEISAFIDRLVEKSFLYRASQGRGFQTSPLGAEVLSQTKVPLIKGAMWMLGKKDEEGDSHVGR